MQQNLIGVLAVGACAASSLGQAGVLYRMESGSTLTVERCLPPCMCPSGPQTVPLRGTFTLTRIEDIPWFAQYRLSSIDWTAAFKQGPVSVFGQGTYIIGGDFAYTHQLDMTLVVLDSPIADPIPYTSGMTIVGSAHPFPEIGITAQSEQRGCLRYTVTMVAAPHPCQADCDGSNTLTGNDFTCFINRFAIGDAYANCDGSTGSPRLTANDFVCYVNRFSAGCS